MAAQNANYFLGRIFDIKTASVTQDPLLLDPANLTTHAVVTGMTGSGKTGLCIGLLEEAALRGTPAIIIDPKGDLTNLLLHFPNLLPADFEPWIDPEIARREGKPVPQVAVETADRWKKGLADWGLGPEQIQQLADSADFTIYTPGSKAGVPVNILSSFEAPEVSWEENSEALLERISSTVTALLGLIGFTNIDPLRSREHILISNLIQNAWMNGKSLTMTELILQVQNPPMDHLGAFPMDSFYNEKDRFSLAQLLNNFLASPSFQVWQQGQPLDIGEILTTKTGKPRHSIFYIAHLSENERMFFVTLLFSAAETWMRGQQGTGNLRALLYFDEIMGYLPPVANPPSKTVMLRMLKQARAFGVGLLFATQNPVDVDYKALSNAGTWMIGRLQTDQDKQRLMDGLSSVSGTTNLAEIDKMISGLQKRVFMLHSVYKPGPTLFSTRWTMNYLAGPLTKAQIPALIKLSGTKQPEGAVTSTDATGAPVKPAAQPAAGISASRPAIPGSITEFVMPNDLGVSDAAINANLPGTTTSEAILYRAALLCQAEIRYTNRQYNLDYGRKVCAIVEEPGIGLVAWEKFTRPALDPQKLQSQTLSNAQYHTIPGFLAQEKKPVELQKDFIDWLYRNGTIRLKANQLLKVYARPETSDEDFKKLCADAIGNAYQAEVKKVEQTFETRLENLKRKIETQELDVKNAEKNVSARTLETVATGGAALLGMLSGRKRSLSSSISKGRMASAAKDKANLEKQTLEQLKEQLADLMKDKEQALADLKTKWEGKAGEISEIPVSPTKSNIYMDLFGVIWLPYYVVNVNGQKMEIPAFKQS